MCLVLIALLYGFAVLIRDGDAQARRALADRFESRAVLTGSFTRAFVDDRAERQRRQAERLLDGPAVDRRAFDGVVTALELEEGLLLDRHGGLLHAWPARPELTGHDMTAEHAHLRTAVAGTVGVSALVPSGSADVPVVTVAVPFDSAAGRRVFSGTFAPTATALGAYLDSVVAFSGGSAYLVDDSGDVLAGDDATGRVARTLDDDLSVGVSERRAGRTTIAVAAVPGVPWRVVLVAPTEEVYAPVAGRSVAPWALWLAFAAAGSLAILLVIRLGRDRATAATSARTDPLTGLPNRRALHETLEQVAALSARHGVPLSALMIDIDHFKTINDALGHHGGDRVLRATAAALVAATRRSDIAGRWGGEEFLALLPHTDTPTAVGVADRIRENIATTVSSDDRTGSPVTASVGVASLRHGDTALLLRQADTALYAAKAKGRNRVESCGEFDDEQPAGRS